MAIPSPTLDINASRPASGLVSPRHVRSRTQSISSDRPSTIGYGFVLPPLSVSPEAAFIAHSAASQIITNDHDSHADAWYDQNGIEPATETATVSTQALHLVNGFLDQLLFNFLQVSKSTTLSALRPAVVEVLKPKLAKDAISNADEELREYLGGANEDEYAQPQGSNPRRDWDAELAWKRTRLRCMVYSSLGDFEEEDEDAYMEEENLEIGANEQSSDVISPAVAIFLTSVVEYMGELTLTVAGQAAYQRVRSKIEKELKDGTRNASNPADRIVVGDLDMERVALDRTLGRLWRGWKKRMRTPITDIAGRPFSKGSSISSRQEQGVSGHEIPGLPKSASSDLGSEFRRSQEHLEEPIIEDVQPVDIPLPIGERDVDEIEVPGLTHYSDDEGDDEMDQEEGEQLAKRPKSLLINSSVLTNGLPTPTKSQQHTPVTATRQRSTSLPTLGFAHFHQKSRKHTLVSAPDSEADQGTATKGGIAKAVCKENAPASGIDPTTERDADVKSQSSESEYDDAEEEVAYEKAEILTSSRVSVSGSAHSTDSDNPPLKRSSSVHSARIIDVSPRSPSHSRPTSIDATDRRQRTGLSGVTNGFTRVSNTDDRFKAISSEPLVKASSITPSPRSSHERRKPSVNYTAPISELEEEVAPKSADTMAQQNSAPDVAAVSTAGSTGSPSPLRKKAVRPPVTLNTKALALTYEQSPVSARAVPLPATPASPNIEEDVPALPKKASGHSNWSSPKPEGRGLLSIERTRTRESDELSLPVQQNTTGARQVHTAASSVSSGTSRLKPVRTSEDNSSRSESVARNFEELIQSNQTITYTLTPENMRDIDSKGSLDSPVVTKFARRKSEDARVHQHSPKASPIVAHSGVNNLPSPRLPPAPSSPKVAERMASSSGSKSPGSVQRVQTGSIGPTAKSNASLARDARVPPISTSDFAEFIKSTGPADEGKPYTVPKLTSPVSPSTGHRDSRRASAASSVNRLRHQPREAAVDSRADNSDLIDFIRQGPPIAASNHRIPRHVAPFRTTMDSDQMSGAIGGRAVDASIPDFRSSRASTNMTESSMPSMQSSVNSRSALIKNKAPTIPSKPFDDDGGMMPKRKTRRVRDPYAIDFSDEDEDGEQDDDDHILDTPKLPVKKEESLAEFLKNYDPPPEPVSAPTPRLPKKKASAPSLMGRFTRSNKDKEREKEKDTWSIKAPSEARTVSRASSGRGHIPIQVNMPPGYDRYGSMGGSHAASRPRGTSMASSTGARVPMKKFEPREAVSKRSETSDLAAFLRDSAPPPDNSPLAIDRTSARQEDTGGISRMFGRRKKSLAV